MSVEFVGRRAEIEDDKKGLHREIKFGSKEKEDRIEKLHAIIYN